MLLYSGHCSNYNGLQCITSGYDCHPRDRQQIVMYYNPLSKRGSVHQGRKVISGFPRSPDVTSPRKTGTPNMWACWRGSPVAGWGTLPVPQHMRTERDIILGQLNPCTSKFSCLICARMIRGYVPRCSSIGIKRAVLFAVFIFLSPCTLFNDPPQKRGGIGPHRIKSRDVLTFFCNRCQGFDRIIVGQG